MFILDCQPIGFEKQSANRRHSTWNWPESKFSVLNNKKKAGSKDEIAERACCSYL